MSKAPLGTGERFRALVNKLKKKGAYNPEALAAWIGRRKYGSKRFAQLSARARKRKRKGWAWKVVEKKE